MEIQIVGSEGQSHPHQVMKKQSISADWSIFKFWNLSSLKILCI